MTMAIQVASAAAIRSIQPPPENPDTPHDIAPPPSTPSSPAPPPESRPAPPAGADPLPSAGPTPVHGAGSEPQPPEPPGVGRQLLDTFGKATRGMWHAAGEALGEKYGNAADKAARRIENAGNTILNTNSDLFLNAAEVARPLLGDGPVALANAVRAGEASLAAGLDRTGRRVDQQAGALLRSFAPWGEKHHLLSAFGSGFFDALGRALARGAIEVSATGPSERKEVVPNNFIGLKSAYASDASPEFKTWLNSLGEELRAGEPSIRTAKILAFNERLLSLSEGMWERVRNTLYNHYRVQGLEPVAAPDHAASEDLLAAMYCESFGISVPGAVAEFRSRDWSELLRARTGVVTESPAPFYFSDFIRACMGAIIAPRMRELSELAPQEHERIVQAGGNTPSARMSADADYQARIAARDAIRDKNFRFPGVLPDAITQPEGIIMEVFGATRTALVLRGGGSAPLLSINVPEKKPPSPYRFERGQPPESEDGYRIQHMFGGSYSTSGHDEKVAQALERNAFAIDREYAAKFNLLHDPQSKIDRGRYLGMSRWLTGYADLFGPSFNRDVSSWDETMSILDSSAGAAGFFASILEKPPAGLNAELPMPRSTPHELVAVSLKQPDSVANNAVLTAAQAAGTFRYIEGRFGQDGFPLEHELAAHFDRFTLSYGQPVYDDFFRALFGHGLMLKEGGEGFFNLELPRMTILDEQGRKMSVEDVFKSIKGIELAPTLVDADREIYGTWIHGTSTGYMVRRTAEPLRVPVFERTVVSAGSPPVVVYRRRPDLPVLHQE